MNKNEATETFERLEENKQKQVFDAAVAEFAANGYSNASMNHLTKSAGISKGSIFQYFKSKEGLFAFVISSAENKVKKYLKAIIADTPGKDFFALIRALLLSGFDFISRHPNLARIYFHVLQSGDAPSSRKISKKLNKRAQNFIKNLIIDAVEKKELRADIDINRTAFLLDSMFNNLLRAYYIEYIAPNMGIFKSNKPELDSWVEETINLLKNGLKRG